MKVRRTTLLAAAVLLVAPMARSGHELPVYPSYYPHEIEIAAMTPQRAAELMPAGKLHAYVGAAPGLAAMPTRTIGSVASLGSFVIVRLNASSALARDEASACATAAAIMRDMAARANHGEFIVHPYPVTPWHGDYLHHADLAEAAVARLATTDAASSIGPGLKVRAEGALAQGLVRPAWRWEGADWDFAIQETGVRDLVRSSTAAVNGWLGPRWTRSGWFHAHRLLADRIAEPQLRRRVDADLDRLQADDVDGVAERVNLERDLVRRLTAGCGAVVAGYTVKREYFNAEFSAGIENIAHDALEGLASPMFLRTVKLKDFPWNGWLHLGIEAAPEAAWNPVGGLTDAFGRLLWFAIGDPAAVPSPYDQAWTLNRISEVESTPHR